MSATKITRVRLLHNASIPGARWCEPLDWEPANQIDGSEFVDGGWWDAEEQTAGLVWFGDRNAYGAEEVIDASLDDLRVASCGDCRVIGAVELSDSDHAEDPLAALEFAGHEGERRWQELRREMDAAPRGGGEPLGEDVPL